MNVFIVPGFGLPTDFGNDPTYISYLNKVVAHVMNFTATHPEGKLLVIFSGGNSDLDPPFIRTEAEEMQKLFLHLAGDNLPGLNMELEKASLSSLPKTMVAGADRASPQSQFGGTGFTLPLGRIYRPISAIFRKSASPL